MASRKQFVAAAAATLGALSARPASAGTTGGSTPSPSPSPSPAPPAAAREFAVRMRAFDPHLSGAEIEAIARGIETNWRLGGTINPKGRALVNSDEPVPAFAVRR